MFCGQPLFSVSCGKYSKFAMLILACSLQRWKGHEILFTSSQPSPARASAFSLRQCREIHPAIRFFELGINPGDRISISLKPCAIESRNSLVSSAQRWERSLWILQNGWIYFVSASSGHCPSLTKKCFTPHRRTSSVADNSQQRQYSFALWPRWWSQKLSRLGLYKKFLTSQRFPSSFCAWRWDLFSSFSSKTLK